MAGVRGRVGKRTDSGKTAMWRWSQSLEPRSRAPKDTPSHGKAARPARVLPGSLRRERGLPTPWFHCLRLGANPGLLFQAARLVTVVHPLWPKVHHRSFLKCSSELRLYPSFPHSGNKCLLRPTVCQALRQASAVANVTETAPGGAPSSANFSLLRLSSTRQLHVESSRFCLCPLSP